MKLLSDRHYRENEEEWEKRMGMKPRKFEKSVDNYVQNTINEIEKEQNGEEKKVRGKWLRRRGRKVW